MSRRRRAAAGRRLAPQAPPRSPAMHPARTCVARRSHMPGIPYGRIGIAQRYTGHAACDPNRRDLVEGWLRSAAGIPWVRYAHAGHPVRPYRDRAAIHWTCCVRSEPPRPRRGVAPERGRDPLGPANTTDILWNRSSGYRAWNERAFSIRLGRLRRPTSSTPCRGRRWRRRHRELSPASGRRNVVVPLFSIAEWLSPTGGSLVRGRRRQHTPRSRPGTTWRSPATGSCCRASASKTCDVRRMVSWLIDSTTPNSTTGRPSWCGTKRHLPVGPPERLLTDL